MLLQKILPVEITVVDQSPGNETKSIINAFRKFSGLPIRHIWDRNASVQPVLLNQAIAQTKSDYIIQLEGNQLLHAYFVADHVNFAKANSFVSTEHIGLNEQTSAEILQHQHIGFPTISKGLSSFIRGLRIPFLWPLFSLSDRGKKSLFAQLNSNNIAYWRKDAIEVNGYNEAIKKAPLILPDFYARLYNAGKQKRMLKPGALSFHIYHKDHQAFFSKENQELLNQTISNKLSFCETGISKHLV